MRARTIWIAGALGAFTVAGAAATAAVIPQATPDPSPPTDSLATVAAERTTLTSDLTLAGTLTFGDEIAVPGVGGVLTRVPRVGDVIAAGDALFEVNGEPVSAVPGARPFWRTLSVGVPDGPDVEQLEAALTAFGFGENVTVDEHFSWATADAIEAWQTARGVEATGTVPLGSIAAIATSPVRVSSVSGRLGESAAGSPLAYTSTEIRGSVTLTQSQARELIVPVDVTVTLPDGTRTPGTLVGIDPGGETTETGTTKPSGEIAFPSQESVADLGLRAITVTLEGDSAADALVVPVTALIADPDGGYSVDVVRNEEVVRVPVDLGLIADTRVQITGGPLVEGDRVVVAG